MFLTRILKINFSELKSSIRQNASFLAKKSYPVVPPSEEDEISFLKKREVFYKNYEVIVFFSESLYDTFVLKTLQIYGKYVTFLPFDLVVEMVKNLLGEDYVLYSELYLFSESDNKSFDTNTRKVYIWIQYFNPETNELMTPIGAKKEEFNYQGLKYRYMDFDKISLI